VAEGIVAAVGDQVALEKQGGGYKGRCPFHHERAPSLLVNPQAQWFHCLSCGAKGGPQDFRERLTRGPETTVEA